jgi:hypothetical protein
MPTPPCTPSIWPHLRGATPIAFHMASSPVPQLDDRSRYSFAFCILHLMRTRRSAEDSLTPKQKGPAPAAQKKQKHTCVINLQIIL